MLLVYIYSIYVLSIYVASTLCILRHYLWQSTYFIVGTILNFAHRKHVPNIYIVFALLMSMLVLFWSIYKYKYWVLSTSSVIIPTHGALQWKHGQRRGAGLVTSGWETSGSTYTSLTPGAEDPATRPPTDGRTQPQSPFPRRPWPAAGRCGPGSSSCWRPVRAACPRASLPLIRGVFVEEMEVLQSS